MRGIRVDQASWRVAICVAAGLMMGVLLAAGLRMMDAVAGRTLHTGLMFWGCVGGGLALGYVAVMLAFRRSLLRSGTVLMSLLLLMLAASVIVQGICAPRLAMAWQAVLNALTRRETQYLSLLFRTGLLFAALPALVTGAAVRVALQMVRQDARESSAGALLTLGVLLVLLPVSIGAGVGSRVLIPWLGFGVLRVAALWFGVLAGLALARGAWSLLPPLAVCLVLILAGPTTTDAGLSAGVFSRLVHRDSGFAYGRPVFTHQTRHHGVAAYEDPDYGFVFAQDGRPLLFGNRFHTARTLTAYVPLLLRPSCARAAVFGPEAGRYLPFLARAGVEDLAVGGCDTALLKLTLAADDHITGTRAETAPVPRRARLTPRQNYDLIVLAGEPMWMRGTRKAYSSRLFARCRSALASGGLVALHVDGRALSARRFAAVVRDFARVFPHMQLWCTGAYDWLLVGSNGMIQSPADQMLACFERQAVMRDFVRARVLALPEALACMVCDGAGVVPWLERTGFESWRANARRVPQIVFSSQEASEELLTPHALEPMRQKTLEWLVPGEMDVGVYQTIRDRTLVCADARTLAARALAQTTAGQGDAGLADARAAAKLNVRDPLLTRLAESLELEGRRRIAIGEFKGGLKCYENLLSFSPGSAHSHYGMGFCLRASGEPETAYLHFARAVAAAPEQIGYRMELAQVAVTVGEYAEADRQYEEILRRKPDHAEALYRYATCLATKERADRNMARALTLAEQACRETGWQNREFAYGLANLYMDAGRVMEGMGLKRRLKEGGLPERAANPAPSSRSSDQTVR